MHRFFGALGGGDIHDRTDECKPAGIVFRRTGHDKKMLHRTIGHQQSVLAIIVPSIAGRAFDELLNAFGIFRMNALRDELQCRLDRAVEPEDPERFLRPEDLSAGDVPAETAGVAEPLGFRQICIRMPQVRVEPGVLQGDRGL